MIPLDDALAGKGTKKPVKITELLLRDAHQSLLATRWKTEDMLPICEALDNVGYYSLEVWGGATFDSCLRYLKEDPWERLRVLKKALPKTPLQMLFRGQNILGYRHYADDVVDRFVAKSVEYGMNIFRIFDALNDTRNLETAIRSCLKYGGHAQGAICYTVSPVHTAEMFVQMGKELEDMGCQSIVIKDMAALMTPNPAYELVKALKSTVKIPVHVHTHATTGVAPMVLLRCIDAGADGVDTAISSLSGGPGHVATESLVESLAGTVYDTGITQESMAPIAEFVRVTRGKYAEFESGHKGSDTRIFLSQIPGGMLSNMESQLRQMNAYDKIDEVMLEVPRVRKDMGYIPLVTPTSQIVGTQAVFNVLMKERYKNVPTESKLVFAGKYGRTPVPVDPEIQKKVLGDEEAITCRPADILPNEFEKLREEIKDKARNDDDVLSYAVFPKVWLEFYEAKLNPNAKKEEPKQEAPKPAATPAPAAAAPAPAAKATGNGNGGSSPLANTRLQPGRKIQLELGVNGKSYEATVEVLEG